MQQRPATGVWASLYTQPLFDSENQLLEVVPQNLRHLLKLAPDFVHVLTHKDLHLHACHVLLPNRVALGEGFWFSAAQWPSMGLPAPVRKLLELKPDPVPGVVSS